MINRFQAKRAETPIDSISSGDNSKLMLVYESCRRSNAGAICNLDQFAFMISFKVAHSSFLKLLSSHFKQAY